MEASFLLDKSYTETETIKNDICIIAKIEKIAKNNDYKSLFNIKLRIPLKVLLYNTMELVKRVAALTTRK